MRATADQLWHLWLKTSSRFSSCCCFNAGRPCSKLTSPCVRWARAFWVGASTFLVSSSCVCGIVLPSSVLAVLICIVVGPFEDVSRSPPPSIYSSICFCCKRSEVKLFSILFDSFIQWTFIYSLISAVVLDRMTIGVMANWGRNLFMNFNSVHRLYMLACRGPTYFWVLPEFSVLYEYPLTSAAYAVSTPSTVWLMYAVRHTSTSIHGRPL